MMITKHALTSMNAVMKPQAFLQHMIAIGLLHVPTNLLVPLPVHASNGADAGNGRGVDDCRDIDECILDNISTTGLRCITAYLLAANTISVTVDGAAMQLNAYNAVKCNNDQIHAAEDPANARSHYCECENKDNWSQEQKSAIYETGNGPVEVQVCIDIDECARANACPANSICHNLIGAEGTDDEHTAAAGIASPHQPYWCEC